MSGPVGSESPHGAEDCCGDRALCGWSPSPLPADTPIKRGLDRILSRSWAWFLTIAAVSALLNLAAHVSPRGALALDGAAALLGGGMCGANFWRCRHAHCLITSTGWLVLSVVSFVGAATGHSLTGGHEQSAFSAILALALTFEGGWYLVRGTNAVSVRRARDAEHARSTGHRATRSRARST